MEQENELNRVPFFWKLITTFFRAGYFPVAPGTAGSILALIPAIFIMVYAHYPYIWLSVLILIFTILGVVGSTIMERHWCKDPQQIVVDEAVGMWISILFIPFRWYLVVASFVLFRFFDIFKPLGLRKVQNLKGGYGVMADDILAGILTNVIIQIVLVMFKI